MSDEKSAETSEKNEASKEVVTKETTFTTSELTELHTALDSAQAAVKVLTNIIGTDETAASTAAEKTDEPKTDDSAPSSSDASFISNHHDESHEIIEDPIISSEDLNAAQDALKVISNLIGTSEEPHHEIIKSDKKDEKDEKEKPKEADSSLSSDELNDSALSSAQAAVQFLATVIGDAQEALDSTQNSEESESNSDPIPVIKETAAEKTAAEHSDEHSESNTDDLLGKTAESLLSSSELDTSTESNKDTPEAVQEVLTHLEALIEDHKDEAQKNESTPEGDHPIKEVTTETHFMAPEHARNLPVEPEEPEEKPKEEIQIEEIPMTSASSPPHVHDIVDALEALIETPAASDNDNNKDNKEEETTNKVAPASDPTDKVESSDENPKK